MGLNKYQQMLRESGKHTSLAYSSIWCDIDKNWIAQLISMLRVTVHVFVYGVWASGWQQQSVINEKVELKVGSNRQRQQTRRWIAAIFISNTIYQWIFPFQPYSNRCSKWNARKFRRSIHLLNANQSIRIVWNAMKYVSSTWNRSSCCCTRFVLILVPIVPVLFWSVLPVGNRNWIRATSEDLYDTHELYVCACAALDATQENLRHVWNNYIT